MQRLHGLKALVAALTILANGFAQHPLISTPIVNSSISESLSLETTKTEQTLKETSFFPRDKKSLSTLRIDDLKKITSKSNPISLTSIDETTFRTKTKSTQALLTNVGSFPTFYSSNLTKNYVELAKSEFIRKSDKRQISKGINDSNLRQSSIYNFTLDKNYPNEHSTSSKIKFSQVLQPSNKVQFKFNQLALPTSLQEGKKFLISSLITYDGEAYTKVAMNHQNLRRPSSERNVVSPRDMSASRFNQLIIDRPSFTIKELAPGNSLSFITTDTKTQNEETVINEQEFAKHSEEETLPNNAINVNGNSGISLPKIAYKDSTIGKVSEENKFGMKTGKQNRIGLWRPNEILNHKELKDLEIPKGTGQTLMKVIPKMRSKNLFVLALLKPGKREIQNLNVEEKADVSSVTQVPLENRLCQTYLNKKIEIKQETGNPSVLPLLFSGSRETVSEEIDPKPANADSETTLPLALKKRSIKCKLCKVSLSTCLLTNESTQPKNKWNSKNHVNLSILFENLSRKGKEYTTKLVSPLIYSSRITDFNNREAEISLEKSLDFEATLKHDIIPEREIDAINQKTRTNKMKANTLNDVNSIPKDKLMNSHEKSSRSQLLKDLPSSTNHIFLNALKGQLQFSSNISNRENKVLLDDQYFQSARNKERRSIGIIFLNSSDAHGKNIKREEKNTDEKFSVDHVRNYTFNEEASDLEDGTRKQFLAKKDLLLLNDSKPNTNDSIIGEEFSHFTKNYSGVQKINKISDISERIDINETLSMNEAFNETGGHLDRTLIDDEESKENMTKASTVVNQWPVKHNAIVEGDLVLGGLMMVHEREDTITCGPIMPQGGIQALEAMLYTLDRLNDQEIIPSVKIGAHILDDCDKDTYGLEMAVDFIKGMEIYFILFF